MSEHPPALQCGMGAGQGQEPTVLCYSPSQKADRAALAGKVSCAQFDAAVEQLNGLIGEMLSKVTGQEQDWHQVQQKLIEELDSKVHGGSSPLLPFPVPPPSHGTDGDTKALCPPPVGPPGVGPAAAAVGGALEERPEAAEGEHTAGGGRRRCWDSEVGAAGTAGDNAGSVWRWDLCLSLPCVPPRGTEELRAGI